MISLNEAHNMRAILENITPLAQEIFLVDSFSSDNTVSIAEEFGVHVVRRKFSGFGDQWNFAMQELPITAPWTMKLDPDERIGSELATAIRAALLAPNCDGYTLDRRLWFMGTAMPVKQRILRLWRTGSCHFSDVLVNEHPIVEGDIGHLTGILEHHDSPDLHHWFDKQNRYTTAEAQTAHEGRDLAAAPRFFGTRLERRMWLKSVFRRVPGRHILMFFYCYVWMGAYKSGQAGLIWAKLRVTYFKMIEFKIVEMQISHPTRQTSEDKQS